MNSHKGKKLEAKTIETKKLPVDFDKLEHILCFRHFMMGAEIEYKGKTHQVQVAHDGSSIFFEIGNMKYRLNIIKVFAKLFEEDFK